MLTYASMHHTQTLCPPHGRMTLKMAEKSKTQKDWEKANPNKILNKLKALKASSDGTTDKTDSCPPPPAPQPAAEETLESSTAAHATAEAESVDVTEEVVSSPVVSPAEETKQPAALAGGGHANGSEASSKIKEGGKKGGGGGTWEATREDWKIDAHAQDKTIQAAPEA